MRKILVFLCVVSLVSFTVPASAALFVNGGFEENSFNGWTVQTGGKSPSYGIWNSSSTMPGLTTDINPYNGNYMARIGDSAGWTTTTNPSNRDWVKLSQTSSAIQTTDLKLYINWGAALVEPTNTTHDTDEQPYFSVRVLFNGVQADYMQAYANDKNPKWTKVGTNAPGWSDGNMLYMQDTYSYDLTTHVGEQVTVELYVLDCGLGGHGGFAFLDGIGSTYEPPATTPEPASMLLLGLGLVGLAGFRKRS